VRLKPSRCCAAQPSKFPELSTGECHEALVGPTDDEREQERRANCIRHREILKLFGWTESDYQAALKFGFPNATGQTMPDAQYFWLRTAIAEWKDGLLGIARTLK
jgi:hypothetical protein